MKRTVWQLKSSHDRRFKSGHPWVFSNELAESPKAQKTFEAGGLVELKTAGGAFLAFGYGNPSSLISFRALSRDPKEDDCLSSAFFLRRFRAARLLREGLGFLGASYRLCFGEADDLPGLVVDVFERAQTSGGRVVVVQLHTAGMDRAETEICEALSRLWEGQGDLTLLVQKDLSSRALEGLKVEKEVRILNVKGQLAPGHLEDIEIKIRSVDPAGEPVVFSVDLIGGQKTGFFLDQWANIQLGCQQLFSSLKGREKIRLLDLCSYVGQWSTQIAGYASKRSIKVEATALDSSQRALEFAKKNVTRFSNASFRGFKCDVLQPWSSEIQGQTFDWVVCDPPAFVKSKKDLGPGKHAYLTLNEKAMKAVRVGGVFVSCSCSAQLSTDDFAETLSKAARRAGVQFRWVARGALSPDHPVLVEFEEGQYLKSWFGIRIL